MADLLERIKKDAEERTLRENDGNQDFLLYLERKAFKKGETIDAISKQIPIKRPAYAIFVDDEPTKNFAHRCHYLLYDAESGEFLEKIRAEFPHFLKKKAETLELFRTSKTVERLKRKKKLIQPFDLARLSPYHKPYLPIVAANRYAILFSGASNGRHVNDMEFLYRTLIDVYDFAPDDIYVLNYDGSLDYNTLWWETPVASGFGPDGSAFRMSVNGAGNRADFQSVLADLAGRIGRDDFLLIHTNNHGGWEQARNEGFLVTLGDDYFANDFGADLATLPSFRTLLVVMEQCHSGAFSQPVMNNSPAARTVFQAAVPWNDSSAGGWPFDPWAEMWISAMAGVRGDGTALATSPDDSGDNRISAWEAYDYALSIDDPVMAESEADLSQKVYLTRYYIKGKEFKEPKEIKEGKELKEFKETKELKEPKEIKETKEPKEFKETKELKEPKEIKETKEPKEVKEIKEHKEWKEPKEIFEGGGKIFDTLPDQALGRRFSPGSIEGRLARLEEMVDKLTPFIQAEQRPKLGRSKKTE